MRTLAVICLSGYLFLTGIKLLFNLSFAVEDVVLGLLAIGAGLGLLFGSFDWPSWKRPGPGPGAE